MTASTSHNVHKEEETVALLEAEPEMVTIAMTTRDSDDERTCRICGDGEEDQENALIRPCKCKGSMMYIHIDCLNRWRAMSPRQESHVQCDLCHYHYNVYRPKFAYIVSHPYFLRSITVVTILLLIVGMAYVSKAVHVYFLHGQPDESWHGPTFLWLDRIYLLAGLITVSLLGIVYLVYCCATASPVITGEGPLLYCDTCPWYGCYVADFTACSGDAALGGILVFAAFVMLLTIAFGILGVFSGIYTLTEHVVQHVAGRVKDRILEVQDS
ncbi:hypothetical protein BJV82DRAFT_612278 [Fennellomyces sp. T-0311]|nr:hypothetical protein BJV82DRAFT_612278 [Fennellomyces sp. T-0311]